MSGQLSDNVQSSEQFNHQKRGVDRTPIIPGRRLLRKKYKKHFLSFFQKTKKTQTSESVFAGRIEQIKKTKFELDLMKIVDCFLDGNGNYTIKLAFIEIKPFLTKIFLSSKEKFVNQLIVQMM